MAATRARQGRRRTAMFAAVVALGLAAAPAAPASAAAASWKAQRTEEFTGSSLPKGCGNYAGAYAGGKSGWTSKEVKVSDGLLKLSLEKRKTSGQPYSSGGMGCWDWAQKYGRYEVRAKIPQGKGIDSYITLQPVKGGEGAWTGIELLAPDVETAYVTNGYGTKAETTRVNGNFSDAFHTYVIEWAPKYLRITVDGDEIYFSTHSYNGARWFGLVTSNGDALTGVPDADTKLPAEFQIDRIKISSYTGVPPKHTVVVPPSTAASPTPAASVAATQPAKVPAVVPSSADSLNTQPTADDSSPTIAGGIWPWLLGGSLIAAAAAALLSHPRLNRRHHDRQPPPRPREPSGR